MIVVIIIVGAILAVMLQQKQKAQRKEAIENKIKGNQNLNLSRRIDGVNNFFVFGVDESNKKIIYVTPYRTVEVPFRSIIGVELIEDATVLLKKSTTRTVGGAVIGGALAGGVGSIIGGLSGASIQQNKVSQVKVKLLLRDLSNPSLEIMCFDSKTMTTEGKSSIEASGKAESWIYKKGRNDAEQITDFINVIIDLTDKEIDNDNVEEINDIPAQKVKDDLVYEIIRLKGEGKIIPAVQLCVREKKMTLSEATEFVKNI